MKTPGRPLYSIAEAYIILYMAFLTIPQLSRAKKKGFLEQKFIERIMLAVTEVNGCDICSYAHTKMALEAGLNDKEIQNLLAGLSGDVPPEELPAVMFAQHYADTRGKPSQAAWDQVNKTYGRPKALGILGAVRVMMMGNTYGIPWSSFFKRLKGKPDKRSSLPYELGMLVCSILFVPVAAVHAALSGLAGDTVKI